MRSIVVASLALSCAAAFGQSMKPGLWEVSTRMQGAAGGQLAEAQAQMQEQMKNMPPEQRKMMEERMAQRGMRMGPGGPGTGMTVQMCVTKEMAERHDMPQGRGECRTTSQQKSGNTMKVAFACSNPPSTGEAQMTFSGPEAYSSKVTVNTTVNGRPETMNMDSSGKWLASDCGSVKPPMMPKK